MVEVQMHWMSRVLVCSALQRQLDDAYQWRAGTILDALSDGHSLREIAEFLGVSHTMVAKAILRL